MSLPCFLLPGDDPEKQIVETLRLLVTFVQLTSYFQALMEDYVYSEMQELLLALDKLGKSFGCNRDLYYTLGEYLGYTKDFLFFIEQSQSDPMAWILCSA